MASSQIEWDEAIYYVSMAYNSTVQATTKFTPAMLMYGREMSYPLDLIIGIPKMEQNFTPQNYVTRTETKFN